MPIYDDDYLDDILRGLSMSESHKHNVRKLHQRFNLPDDDILFLYLASLEYTVKLCEDILGGINTQRTAIEQSAQEVQAVGSYQAEAIIKQMIEASRVVIAKFQESGMAATSAIAEANGSVLNKSRETIREAIELKDILTALRSSIEQDRETNINVLKVLLERMGQSIGSQNSVIQEINNAKKDIKQLHQGMTLANTSRWFSPLARRGRGQGAGGRGQGARGRGQGAEGKEQIVQGSQFFPPNSCAPCPLPLLGSLPCHMVSSRWLRTGSRPPAPCPLPLCLLLAALLLVFLVGIGTEWWYWQLKWNDSLSVLGRNLVNWNADRILLCQKDKNPKCTLWIVTPPEQRQ